MIAQRRKTCEEYVKGGETVYSYRFGTPTWNGSASTRAAHGVNVAFNFQNISGTLGPLPQNQSYNDLSTNIGKAYVGFVNDPDPNQGGSNLPVWPKYDLGTPQNMVLNGNGSFIEPDTFRAAGISFINSISRQLLA